MNSFELDDLNGFFSCPGRGYGKNVGRGKARSQVWYVNQDLKGSDRVGSSEQ